MSETFEEYFKKTWCTSGKLEDFNTDIERAIWNHQQKKLQAEREKVALLEMENDNLKDCFLEAMEVQENWQSNNLKETYEKLKELEGEG